MNDWIGLTVSAVLSRCGTNYKDVQLVDEPPGKLRAIEFFCHQGGRPRRVVLEIQPHSDLFSAERSWDQTLVEAQKVLNVHRTTGFLY